MWDGAGSLGNVYVCRVVRDSIKKSLLWTIVGIILVILLIAILQLTNFKTGMLYVLIGSSLFALISLFIFASSIKKV